MLATFARKSLLTRHTLLAVTMLLLVSDAEAVRFYGSFTADEEIGGTLFLEEDVLLIEDATVSLFQATSSFFTQEEDIDALFVDETGDIYFSTSSGATIASGVDGGAGGIDSGDIIRYSPATSEFSLFLADSGPNVDALWLEAGVPYLSYSTDGTAGSNSLPVLDDQVFTLTGGSGTDVSAYFATVVLDSNDLLLDPGEEPDSGTDIDAFAIADNGDFLFSASSSNRFFGVDGDPDAFVDRDGGVIFQVDPNNTATFDAREESSVYYDATATLMPTTGSTNIDAIHFLPAEAPIIDADFNGDTVVDTEDYTIWRDTLGATGLTPYDQGDANGDGNVTVADYGAWRREFGSVALLTSEPAAVPEPSTVAMALAASAAAIVNFARRRSLSN